jgi:mannose-6-phosphate isomerase-like protein (cupin superfamily)
VTHVHDAPPPADDPVEVFGDIETEALGLAYGGMVFRVKAGCSTEPHSHASEETWVVRSGRAVATVAGRDTELRPGTRLTIPPHAEHVIASDPGEDLTVVGFWWRESRDAG